MVFKNYNTGRFVKSFLFNNQLSNHQDRYKCRTVFFLVAASVVFGKKSFVSSFIPIELKQDGAEKPTIFLKRYFGNAVSVSLVL